MNMDEIGLLGPPSRMDTLAECGQTSDSRYVKNGGVSMPQGKIKALRAKDQKPRKGSKTSKL